MFWLKASSDYFFKAASFLASSFKKMLKNNVVKDTLASKESG